MLLNLICRQITQQKLDWILSSSLLGYSITDRRTDRRMKATTKSSIHTHVVVVAVVVYFVLFVLLSLWMNFKT